MFGNAGSRAGRNWLHAPYVEWDPVNKQLVMSDRQVDGVALQAFATDGTVGSEDYDLIIKLMAAGAAAAGGASASAGASSWAASGSEKPEAAISRASQRCRMRFSPCYSRLRAMRKPTSLRGALS